MQVKFRPHLKSFIVFVVIFIVEVLIAKYVDDSFIRPYGGDILVVILIYYFFKSFVEVKPLYLVIGVVLFAYLVEIGQYFHLAQVLNVQDNKILRIVIGSTFSWGDLICYTVGGAICYLNDRKKN